MLYDNNIELKDNRILPIGPVCIYGVLCVDRGWVGVIL